MSGFLTRRLVFAHLRGIGITLDLQGLRDLAQTLEELVALGDGLETAFTDAEVVMLWTLRQEVQQRMAVHPGGDAAAEGLDHTPLGQVAWDVAEAAAARVPGGPQWTRAALPESLWMEGPAAVTWAPAEAVVVIPAGAGPAASDPSADPAVAALIGDHDQGMEPVAFAVPQGAAEEPELPARPAADADATGAPPAEDKARASMGLFSRAILRLHDAVENMAAPAKAPVAAQPVRGRATARPT